MIDVSAEEVLIAEVLVPPIRMSSPKSPLSESSFDPPRSTTAGASPVRQVCAIEPSVGVSGFCAGK